MATVKLDWQKFPTVYHGAIYRSKIKARNSGDELVMEVNDWGPEMNRKCDATAYYRLEGSQRRIPLYDDAEFDSPDDAQKALTQWYLHNAPALVATLAG